MYENNIPIIFFLHSKNDAFHKMLLNNPKGWDRHASHYLDILYSGDERMTTPSTSTWSFFFFYLSPSYFCTDHHHQSLVDFGGKDDRSNSIITSHCYFFFFPLYSLSSFMLLHLLQVLSTLEIDNDRIDLWSIKRNISLYIQQ